MTAAVEKITPSASVRNHIAFANNYLSSPEITEVVVNGPGELWTLADQWERHECNITEIGMEALARSVARLNNEQITSARPIMTARLHGGERIHITRPPVTDTHTITIRKPSSSVITADQYRASGMFDIEPSKVVETQLSELYESGDHLKFLTAAVAAGHTVVVAGSTGSGKTTLLRMLMQHIPADARIITCEDVSELQCTHANHVRMFYQSANRQLANKAGDMAVTATDVIKSSMRMLPSRILVGEIRGGECMDLLSACASGHSGSLTSIHAGSAPQALERLCMMALQSDIRMPYEAIQRLVSSVIDVVVHIGSADGQRRVTEVLYRP